MLIMFVIVSILNMEQIYSMDDGITFNLFSLEEVKKKIPSD